MSSEDWIFVGKKFVSKHNDIYSSYFNGLYIKAYCEYEKEMPMLKYERLAYRLMVLNQIYYNIMKTSEMKNTAIQWRDD